MDIDKEKARRINQWSKGIPMPPSRIIIFPTNYCNQRCRFCVSSNKNDILSEDELEEYHIRKIVKEAKDLGVLEWTIVGGGEPLFKKYTFELMELIKANKMLGLLNTNGTLFTDEKIRKLIEIGWDEIWFSIEGSNAKIHDYHTQVNGSFKKSIDAIKLFNFYKRKFGKKLPKILITTTITNRNYFSIPKIIKFARKYCEGIILQRLDIYNEEGRKLELNEKEYNEFISNMKKIEKVLEKNGFRSNIKYILEEKRQEENQKINNENLLSSICFNPWYTILIYPNGKVTYCCAVPLEMIKGDDPDVKKNSLKSIWYGKNFNEIRKTLLKRFIVKKVCDYCFEGLVDENENLSNNLKKYR